ncbi:Phosphomevalonate kinase [Scheffersomyces xylosifermentans]|uniref:Phosphomevalonate kinase n=1 Tax=Scheffersomyces xylosifermentans TaxID=1304137 RepID=UPI00315C5136
MSQAFSAPGKALLAGGYLVLDPSYNSYVTALSSRMHVVLRLGQERSDGLSSIKVLSPQFHNGEWEYITTSKEDLLSVKEVNDRVNPFLIATVNTVLAYIQPSTKYNVQLNIYSDPGYHSQENTTPKLSINGKRSFLCHTQAIHEVAKTGLGSSAGLVSVVTAALISYFGKGKELDKNVVHNVAQIAHCYAQKKIGSGFDVAAAVYGSIIYRRFQPKIIEDLLQHPVFSATGDEKLQKEYSSALRKVVDSDWDFNHTPCTLPPHIRLLMGDIQGGSETPKLVSKILQWKKEKPEQSSALYKDLNAANESLITALDELHKLYKEKHDVYSKGIKFFSDQSIDNLTKEVIPDFTAFYDLISSIKSIRLNLRKLTEYSGASVEPKEQTALLDDCITLKGCFGGVVPGAGGYDAICLLMVDDSIGKFVQASKSDSRFEKVTWLNLHEEKNGIIVEDVRHYLGL